MQEQLKHIESLSSEGASDYLIKVHQSTLDGKDKKKLIDACEAKISKPNIDVVIETPVVESIS